MRYAGVRIIDDKITLMVSCPVMLSVFLIRKFVFYEM